jgi:hypothetical protein
LLSVISRRAAPKPVTPLVEPVLISPTMSFGTGVSSGCAAISTRCAGHITPGIVASASSESNW